MEENNNQELDKKHICFEGHCWKKCLAMLCAAFLGGFLAFYFVADQMAERYHRNFFNPKHFEKRMFHDMDKMYKRDMKAFDDAFKKFDKIPAIKNRDLAMPVFMMDSVKIKTEFEDDKFNIIIGLKPFQDDADKVNYNVEWRKLTVFGNSEVKDKNFEQDVAFSQDFILPENADTANITKEKDGHKLVISVPLKD